MPTPPAFSPPGTNGAHGPSERSAIAQAEHAPNSLHLVLPELTVSAGAGGARLTMRLLRPTALVLAAGHWCIVHDPVGLTGERLLACVYRAVAGNAHGAASEPDALHTPVALRWLLVRPPMALVCEAAEELATRSWQAVPGGRRFRPPPRHEQEAEMAQLAQIAQMARVANAVRGAGLVAEAPPYLPRVSGPGQVSETVSAPASGAAAPAYGSTALPAIGPAATPATVPAARPATRAVPLDGVLLLSESHRPDAVSHTAAARLVLRAVRHRWSVLAATRDAPITAATSRDATPPRTRRRPAPPWRSHWMCERGVLVPCRAAID